MRTMKIADQDSVVVNGFHPHQLAHYTDHGRYLSVMLISSDTSWSKLRDEMLGNTYPEKAIPDSIRGILHKDSKDYGFDSVTIPNNAMHLSAGPAEALFEIDNFLNVPFGIDFLKEEANLAKKLKLEGVSDEYIKKIIHDKDVHSMLEHKDTEEAVKVIKGKFKSEAS